MKKILLSIFATLFITTSLVMPASAAGIPDYPGIDKLTRGVENSAVKEVQKALIKLGYPISVANGKYGPQTTSAIKDFYFEQGDIDEGLELGPAGWKVIFQTLNNQESKQPVVDPGVVEDNSQDQVTPDLVARDGEDPSRTAIRSEKVAKVLAIAASVKGTKYVRGGTTTKGFDCSGFVLYAMKSAGVKFGRTSRDMRKETPKISREDLRPGDLVFYHNKKGTVYHVAIYAGNGKIWHARRPGLRLAKTNIYAKKVSYGKVNYA